MKGFQKCGGQLFLYPAMSNNAKPSFFSEKLIEKCKRIAQKTSQIIKTLLKCWFPIKLGIFFGRIVKIYWDLLPKHNNKKVLSFTFIMDFLNLRLKQIFKEMKKKVWQNFCHKSEPLLEEEAKRVFVNKWQTNRLRCSHKMSIQLLHAVMSITSDSLFVKI